MAFAVYDNSPLLGYIEWVDLHIQYEGTTHAITDGFTAYRYVWWDPAVSTANLQVSDTLPTLSDDALLLFLNKDGIHVTVPKSTVVDGSLIVSESILASAIGANQIQTGHLDAEAVTAEKIAAGAVVAEKLGAWEMLVGQHIQSIDYDGTDVATGDATSGFRMEAGGDAEFNGVRVRGEITASEFRGVPTTNLLANGTFESNTNGWSTDPDHAGSTIARVTTQAHSGSASLQVGHPSSVGGAITEVDITPGMLLHVSAWVKKQSLHNAPNKWRNDVNLSVVIYAGGTPIYVPGGRTFQMLSTNWQYIECYVPIPSALTTATKARISIASYAPSGSALFVDDVVVGQAPMMEIPYVISSEDDSHLRSLVLPDTVGFAAPHSSYPYGLWAGEIGGGLAALDVRGPSLGPIAPIARLTTDGSGITGITLLADGVSVPSGRLSFDGGNSSAPGLYFEGHPKAGVAYATSGGIAAPILVNENGYYSYVNSSGNGVFPHHSTTTAAANVFMTPNGALVRSTSSRKRKNDVETLDASVIDLLRPVTYRVKPEAAGEGDEPNRERVGFIAEEVAEADERLAQFDEDGEVTYFDMNGLVAHLVAEVQSLRSRVAALEEQVTVGAEG